jgi:hypothetical protein
VTGERQYGNLMDKTTYTTAQTKPTEGKYNVTGSGLKAENTLDGILNSTNMTNLVKNIEAATGSWPDNQINEKTNKGTYDLLNGTPLTKSNITVATQDGTSKQYALLKTGNYNYTLVDGAHTETIDPRKVTIYTEATREYGNAPSVGTNTTITKFDTTTYGSKMTTWDEEKFNNNSATWKATLTDNSKITDHVADGPFGTKGTAGNAYATSGAVVLSDGAKSAITTAFGDNYTVTYADKLTLTQAPLTITVTGERQYGANMPAAATYSTTDGTANIPNVNADPDPLATQLGKYDINANGLKNTDTTAGILSATGVKAKLATVDNGEGNNTDTVGSHTNIGTYTGASTVKFTLDNTNTQGTTNTILSSGDYYVAANGNNTLKIVKKPLTLTTTGGKTYDETPTDPTDASKYNITTADLASWDDTLLSNNKTTWIGLIDHKNTAQNAGTYGTNGTNDKDGYLTYTSTNQDAIKGVLSNYDVNFKDLYTIGGKALTLYIIGNRTYGAANSTLSKTSFTATGWVGTDEATYWTTAYKDSLEALYNDTTNVNTTHVGTYGTQGNTDASNTYKTSGAITLTDAQKTDVRNKAGFTNYIITFDDQLTINPAPLTVTVNGERTYGNNMTQNSYTTATTVTPGTWNVKMTGLVGLDTETPSLALNDTALKGVLNNLDNGDGTATTTLGSHTNARDTAYKLGTDLTGTSLTITDSILKTQAQGGKDYTITNGDHDVKIDTRNVTITTKGEKVYGNADPATTSYTVDDTSYGSGLTSWDKAAYFTPNVNTWKNSITNSTDEATHHGTYGTKGTTGTTKVLDYAGTTTEATIANALNANGTTTNYNVTFEDLFTINQRQLTITTSGSKTYGDANPAAADLAITAATATADTGLVDQNGNLATFNTYATGTGTGNWRSLVTDAATTNTHAGTHGTNGTMDTTGILTYTTDNKNTISGNLDNDYDIKYQDLLTVNKAQLTVTVTGERTYGDNMTASSYTTSTAATAPTDTTGGLTSGKWNVNLSGLKGTDTATVLSATNVNTILNALDSGAGNNTDTLGSHTNVGTYSMVATAPSLSKTKVDLTNSILAEGDSGNYDIVDGAHQAKIDKADVTITTTGSRKFGHENSTSTYTIDETGMTSWDKTALYGTDGSNWKSGIDNSTTTATEKGVYGTLGNITPKNAVLTYASDSKLATDLATNYTVTYADKYTIGVTPLVITIIGSKTYGDATDTNVNKYTITSDGLEGTDTLKYTGLTNTVGLKADVGTYSKGNGPTTPDTTDGISKELLGLSGFDTNDYEITYKTTYTVTPRELNIVTTGTKVYGDADPSTSSYTVTGLSGLASWESSKLLISDLQTHIVNNTTEQTDVGNYGTQNGGAAVLSYNTDLQAAAGSNYKVNLADNFTITPRPITYSLEGTKDYGTGSEHTVYGTGSFTNVPDFAQATVNGNTAKDLVNTSNRTTNVGDYANSLLTVSHSGAWTKNYTITENATLHVVPADFTYTSDHTSYWQYQHIPAQSGKVTNSYGEDVSDLVGTLSWPTPADGTVVGIFPVWGRGSNDNSGNYHAFQAAGNATALEVKNVPKTDQTNDALNENLEGAWRSFRRPLLDIMYLKIKDNGFKSWDNGVFVTANPYVPAGDKTDYGIITFNGQALK